MLVAPVTYSLAIRLALLRVDTQGQNIVSASTYISSLLSCYAANMYSLAVSGFRNMDRTTRPGYNELIAVDNQQLEFEKNLNILV